MKHYISIFLTVCFGVVMLQAYDMNATIVDGNTTVYQSLLKKLDSEKKVTSEAVLEKSLLQLLLNGEKRRLAKSDLSIALPKNSDAYKELFKSYLELLSHRDKAQAALNQNQEKIETIEDEIGKLDKNSSKALILELQDAVYHKNIHLYKNQITAYTNSIQKIEHLLRDAVEKIEIDTVGAKKSIAQTRLKIQQISNTINGLQINKEQSDLVGNTKASSVLEERIQKLSKKHQKLVDDLVSSEFLLFAGALKNRDQHAFSLEKTILKEAESLKMLSSDDRDTLTLLLHAMENRYLGRLQTLTGSGEEEIRALSIKVWNLISQPIFSINQTPISILKLLITLLIFVAGFVLGALYKRKIKNMASYRRSIPASTRTLLANIGYYIIILIAFFISLNVLGIKLSSLAFIAGALSVGIGFGLQNIVSNLVSGLILMFERSIKIGDYIQLDDNLRGYVSDIRMRSTTITTNENIDVIIPNQKLIENNMVNWTMSDNIRRFSIPFGVAYGTDVHKVIDIVTQTVLNSELKEDIIENDLRKTRVIMTEMADSSVNFELLVWIIGDKLNKPKRTASEFLIIIYDVLNKNNIEIPFPQRDLHIRSVEDTFVIKQGEVEKGE